MMRMQISNPLSQFDDYMYPTIQVMLVAVMAVSHYRINVKIVVLLNDRYNTVIDKFCDNFKEPILKTFNHFHTGIHTYVPL
jgi:hypothetical protein